MTPVKNSYAVDLAPGNCSHHQTMKMTRFTSSICFSLACTIAFGAGGTIALGLDSSFGSNGVAIISTGTESGGATAVAIQSDGKIVAVGFSSDREYREKFAIARFNHDGIPDRDFGTGGVALTAVGVNGSASAVAIQPDGKILVSGHSVVDAATSGFTLLRYNPNGKLDQTFGKGGIVTPPVGTSRLGRASAMVVQTDGKIVVGGDINIRGFFDLAIARYNREGTPDLGFGTDGLVTTAVSKAGARVAAVVIQSDGKIVAVGTSKEITNHFALARYQPNGSLDPAFGYDGIVTKPIGETDSFASAAVIQPDGKIVAIGSSYVEITKHKASVISLARFNPDGTLDARFGKDGMVTTAIGKSSSDASSGAIQPDGKIVVVGRSVKALVESRYLHSFMVARYNSDGTLDSTFGKGGSVITEIGAGTDIANAIAIQFDGKIVAAGYSRNGTKSEFALIRYLP